MKLNRVHHAAIIASDYRRSLDFYTRVLGLTVIAENYRRDRFTGKRFVFFQDPDSLPIEFYEK